VAVVVVEVQAAGEQATPAPQREPTL
jgi:hypothetical protein